MDMRIPPAPAALRRERLSLWRRTAAALRRQRLLLLGLAVLAPAVALLVDELQSSRLQARRLAALGDELSFGTAPGVSEAIRFPGSGPYDTRLGYAALPQLLDRLTLRDYRIAEQARLSPALLGLADRGLFLPYREKSVAGLMLLDRRGAPLYAARYPLRTYAHFDAVPPLLVESLLFIENRGLLDGPVTRNPVLDWSRLSRAALDQLLSVADSRRSTPGGSTLATQIEKYRHSPGGRTDSAREKLRQMASASIRAYLDGEDTQQTRQRLVVDYLNTVPLAARAGHGEVHGIGDGLWAWYGRDFQEINRLLGAADDSDTETLAMKAQAYKEALSLMIAQRRPSYYLLQGRSELEALTQSHLRLLASAGIVPPALRDAALAQPLRMPPPPQAAVPSFVAMKAPSALRSQLSALFDVPRLYDLDRLDLSVTSTFDAELQARVSQALRQLRDPAQARAQGLYGHRLLRDGDDPGKLIVSFTLFERGADRNRLLVQADNVDQPFDLNQGARLDLGSTAKLRTLISYLEVVTELHGRYAGLSAEALRAVERRPRDTLSAWALDYLASAADRSLERMLEAAMDRRYSADPWTQFYTGGGLHRFENFDREDDDRVLSVRESFRRSVNLPFIRLMRDLVHHYMYQPEGAAARLLKDAEDPLRAEYLTRFADQEGREFLTRFYRRYRGKTAEEMQELLLQSVTPGPRRLAAAILSIAPGIGVEPFSELMRGRLAQAPTEAELRALHARYQPDHLSLADRGFLAGVHPLELWLVAYLRAHPGATLSDLVAASRDERQAVYAWLFRTGRKQAQDTRILTLLETEAFTEIAQRWRRLGYPFEAVTPSYAASIGASGDRPWALAELMGIIVNDGVRLPSVRVERLHFAEGTPYETVLDRVPQAAERVLAPEVAQVVRHALVDVVDQGTARRLKGAYLHADGAPLTVGGKTGTGDHRYETFARGGQLVTSRVVNRSATLVFMIGDRHFGSLTAYVAGADAARYSFTSALPVQLLRSLSDELQPLFEAAE
ncbi:MAG: transglycosylase domain-containing protein [Pseudomonadota bacterium]